MKWSTRIAATVAITLSGCLPLAAQRMEIEMVRVPGGTFGMHGSGTKVTLSAYLIGRFDVTQAQYRAVVGSNPSWAEGEANPVDQVSWYDAVEFCNKLSEREGLEKVYSIEPGVPGASAPDGDPRVTMDISRNGYRLPTEAEWEYAARGGSHDSGLIYSGSNVSDEVAWHMGNSGNISHAVGLKQPNELGLYDMSGNVFQWVWDAADDLPLKAQTNPTGPATGWERIVRGGGWSVDESECQVSRRNSSFPNGSVDVGFRVARSLP